MLTANYTVSFPLQRHHPPSVHHPIAPPSIQTILKAAKTAPAAVDKDE